MSVPEKRLKTLGGAMIAIAVLGLLAIAAVFVIPTAGEPTRPDIGMVLAALSFLAFILVSGIGIYRMQRWAYVMGLISGVFLLPVFPIGTFVGIFAFIALNAEKHYLR